MAGGWCLSGITKKLQRNHSGPDIAVPSSLKKDIVIYLLDEEFNIEKTAKNKLVAKRDNVRLYMVMMDFEDGDYTFSTENFYKDMRIPTRFFRQYRGRVPEIKTKDGDLEFPTLTPALFYISKIIYGENMRDRDMEDVTALEKFLLKPEMNEEREAHYKEREDLRNYI